MNPLPALALLGAPLGALVLTLPLGGPAGGDGAPPTDVEAVARARAHYAAVEAELLAKDVSHLSEAQRARRAEMIAELRRYRLAGEFAQDAAAGEFRLPVFRDEHGRHCAVANLLHASGEDALVDAVAGANNDAWVAELAESAELALWLEEVGLSFDEAARIQAPMGGVLPPIDTPGSLTPAPSSPTGPGPAAPSSPGPSVPAPDSPRPGPPAPSSPGTVAPDVASPGTPDAVFQDGVPGWWAWWEFNKLTWLRPNALHERAVTGEDRTRSESELGVLRRAAARLFEERLDDPSAQVRAAAVLALARAQGPAALEDVLGLLDDPQRDVRHAAILALAATRSEEGVHALLELLIEDDEATSAARPVSLAALAVARSFGRGEGVERMLPRLVLDQDDADVDFAAMFLQDLAASDAMAAVARCRSQVVDHEPTGDCDGRHARRSKRDLDASPASGRALEALRADEAEAVLPGLLHQVGGRSLDHRRSAALALADVDGALEPLMTAYELERELLTRGFLALSIAAHGGTDARDFLVHELEKGPKSLRPWNALALGVLARADDDDEARAAIRAGHGKEKNAEHRGAYLLASGISCDVAAREVARHELADPSARTRMFAALALGLIGDDADRGAIAAAMADESSPAARSGMAQALALYGDPRDTEVLLGEIRDVHNPDLQSQLAVALGFHGTTTSLEGLLAELEDLGESGPDGARAAMVDAAGLMLSGQETLALGELSSGSNFTRFPAWMLELLQFTL